VFTLDNLRAPAVAYLFYRIHIRGQSSDSVYRASRENEMPTSPDKRRPEDAFIPSGGVYARKSRNTSPLPLIVFCAGGMALLFVVLAISRSLKSARRAEATEAAAAAPLVQNEDTGPPSRPRAPAAPKPSEPPIKKAPRKKDPKPGTTATAEVAPTAMPEIVEAEVKPDAPADVHPALQPVGQGRDNADLIGDETLDQVIAQLHSSPSVSVRRNAASLLARHRGNSEAVVVALLEGAKKDAAYQVRSACIKALGPTGGRGTRQAEVLAFLRELVYSETSIEDKQLAADALVTAGPNSTHSQNVLRVALVGGKGATPIASTSLEDSSEAQRIWTWRHWAYDKLCEPQVEAEWAVPYLIKIAEAEIDEAWGEDISLGGYSAGLGANMEENADVMFTIAPRSPAVKAHLKKYLNTVLQNWEDARSLKVHYDSLLKKIALLEAEDKGQG
jgi:hypothetical protein